MQESRDMPAREAQVLALAAEGMTDKQIAAELGISAATVDTYWRRTKLRFDAASRTEAVARALNLRWATEISGVRQENERLLWDAQDHVALESALRKRVEEQKSVEAALHIDLGALFEHFWRSRMLAANLGVVMWWANAEPPWRIEWISDSVMQWGYRLPDLDIPILDIVCEEDRIAFEAGALLASRSPGKPMDRGYRIQTREGAARRVKERLVCATHPLED